MNRNYIALGVFVVVTLGLLTWLASAVGALGGPPGYTYKVRLDHAAGLVEDNAIKIAGVHVGVIEDINVDHKTAVLTLRVDKEIVLHDDAVAIVRAKSLLGEKYLQLDPGTQDSGRLTDGDDIPNVRETFEIDQVLNSLKPILGGEDGGLGAALGPLATRIDGLLADATGDGENPPLIEREKIAKALEDTTETISTVRRIAETNEEELATLLKNGNRVLGDPRIPRIIANLDRTAAVAVNEMPGLLKKADKALSNINNVTDELTPEKAKQIAKILDDLEVASANLKKVSGEIKGIGLDIAPLLKNLKVLTNRLMGIDELFIRKFVQEEGVKVNLGTSKKAKERIDDLE